MAHAKDTAPRRLTVVGGGVAGLAAAHEALAVDPSLEVLVLERGHRPGGLVETEHTPQGFVIDHGADCLVRAKPAGRWALRELGLQDDVVGALGAGNRQAFVAHDGRMRPMPAGLMSPVSVSVSKILRSRALSPAAKARLALEPWMPRGPGRDESVESFVTRRFGRGMLEALVEPLLGAIYGAPADRLSAPACLPAIVALEERHGSVARGVREARRSSAREPAADGPPVVSLRGGMDALPQALARALGERIVLRTGVTRIEPGAHGRFALRLEDGGVVTTDALVVATPANVASRLTVRLDPELSELLAGVDHAPLDVVTLAWPAQQVPHPLDGTGFVVAAGELKATTACSWVSRKWPGRAPHDAVLVRSVLSLPGVDDERVVEIARRELRELMGVEASPSLVRVRRRRPGLPVYEVGHLERVERMRDRAAALGRFALAGNAHGGIGVPDCIDSGRRAARTALGAPTVDARRTAT